VSSAILYLAIVAIWAFMLVPRWLRRSHAAPVADADAPGDARAGEHQAQSDAEEDQPEPDTAPIPAVTDQPAPEPLPAPVGAHPAPPVADSPRPSLSRAKVLQARRRLLTTLVLLAVAAASCTVLKLTSGWVCVPPAVMLGMYLLLLREAALADAEHARGRVAVDRQVQAARRRADEESEEQGAQIIDISARLVDQLYDQYADAAIRAVGD
jgi:hypothetical protein